MCSTLHEPIIAWFLPPLVGHSIFRFSNISKPCIQLNYLVHCSACLFIIALCSTQLFGLFAHCICLVCSLSVSIQRYAWRGTLLGGGGRCLTLTEHGRNRHIKNKLLIASISPSLILCFKISLMPVDSRWMVVWCLWVIYSMHQKEKSWEERHFGNQICIFYSYGTIADDGFRVISWKRSKKTSWEQFLLWIISYNGDKLGHASVL